MRRWFNTAALMLCLAPLVSKANTVEFFQDPGGGGAFYGSGGGSLATHVTGGNPGQYRFVDFTVPAGPSWAIAYSTYLDLVFDPSTHGAVTGIDFSQDSKLFVATDPNGMESGLVLLQTPFTYFLKPAVLVTTGGWSTQTLTSLQPEDFVPFGGISFLEGYHPDFSANAPPMAFGFYQQLSHDPEVVRHFAAGFDNIRISVHYVPEPAGMMLVASACLGAWAIGCQRRGAIRSLRKLAN